MIETILVKKGIIDQDILEKAYKIRNDENGKGRRPLAKILYDDLGVSREAVLKEITPYYAIPRIELDEEDITPERIEFISKFLEENVSHDNRVRLLKNKMIPYVIEERSGVDTLLLLTADPLQPELKEIIEPLPVKVEICYTPIDNINIIYNEVNKSQSRMKELLDEIEYEEKIDAGEIAEEEVGQADIQKEIEKSALVKFVDGLLEEAVREGASDIHIIPRGIKETEYKFRIDGDLFDWYHQKGIRPESVAAVFKDKTQGVNRFERERAQDGFIQKEVDNQLIRYRVSIVPIISKYFGRKIESIVIRVLDDRKVIKNLDQIGLLPKAHKDFSKAINSPSGLVIITGPTGSGKSTTLVAALYEIIDPKKCVLTVEDPVEYMIEGARQLKIGEKMDFNQAMRSILRHDPDIALVGEMRDKESALIGMKLANTGHLTFSTLHTNDAPSAVSRLYKMGIEPFLIANSIKLVMAQRLVKTLCENCKEKIENVDKNLASAVGFTEEEIANTTFYRAVGCKKCNEGYKGRTAIMEALYFDKNIKRLIIQSENNIDEEKLREAGKKEGMLSLREAGKKRVVDGITTLEEVLATTVEV
ncbi:MAG: GspE/PulE family protein [Candidatus Marinimicrobia bacterium]|nr:GspE/PulE family protein [Candidatus Neomarinimicrobiota bacterium]